MNKTMAWILLATSALLTTSAWADVKAEPFWLAQLTPEERHRLHERWENATPEERAAVRRALRERWNDAPPELREQQRMRLLERLNRAPSRDRDGPRERWLESQPEHLERDGYGAGYEQRHFENEEGRRPLRPRR